MRPIAIAPGSCLSDHETSIRLTGADALVVDRAVMTPAQVVEAAGGLLLTGGGDVAPALYGESPHPTCKPAEPGRDDYEIELIRLALDADLPILAICRGIQVLNVARGGTLIQDIPDQAPGHVTHVLRDPPVGLAHDVTVVGDSLLARLMGREDASGPLRVNSRHHQAVKAVGTGLTVSAVAADGIIEAVEDSGRRFCLGVQWHPENFHRTGEFAALFAGFVQAARRVSR